MSANNEQPSGRETAGARGIPPPDFRLPEGTSVGAVRLQVTDLDRSLEFYQRVIGARVISRTSDMAALGGAGGTRPLVWLHAGRGVRAVPRGGSLGLFHFALLLPERAALGRFLDHLLRLGIGAGMADHLVSEALYLSDPDGLGIEVYVDRPRHAWRHQGSQLVMATEPLDAAGLVAIAGEAPWDGLPEGSVVGHVHLHVGDLEDAEAFYHSAIGFDKTVWSYPGALFFSAGGYHHHLATNTWIARPPARPDQARLLEWELLVPESKAAAAAGSVDRAGYAVREDALGWMTADPWATSLRIRPVEAL